MTGASYRHVFIKINNTKKTTTEFYFLSINYFWTKKWFQIIKNIKLFHVITQSKGGSKGTSNNCVWEQKSNNLWRFIM